MLVIASPTSIIGRHKKVEEAFAAKRKSEFAKKIKIKIRIFIFLFSVATLLRFSNGYVKVKLQFFDIFSRKMKKVFD